MSSSCLQIIQQSIQTVFKKCVEDFSQNKENQGNILEIETRFVDMFGLSHQKKCIGFFTFIKIQDIMKIKNIVPKISNQYFYAILDQDKKHSDRYYVTDEKIK